VYEGYQNGTLDHTITGVGRTILYATQAGENTFTVIAVDEAPATSRRLPEPSRQPIAVVLRSEPIRNTRPPRSLPENIQPPFLIPGREVSSNSGTVGYEYIETLFLIDAIMGMAVFLYRQLDRAEGELILRLRLYGK
jgi:hypothetical protein